MTPFTSLRILADSQSLTNSQAKATNAELKSGAGYGVDSSAGMNAASKISTDHDKQTQTKPVTLMV
ncbi:hypothetical protein K0H59_20440 [Shewanella sp. FJAT-51649]|uniref:hypothetical protein n=1 Tax=Shewanella sp. FJAT-51649 TaxID=2864210 RepID=UPI001C661237|nr:hypothetical protein [Shewanella sp. FJAT-51649]QYJ71346.1 hypothetical protein K0H59_20440 [Shewanella sp. FJAT-51649]